MMKDLLQNLKETRTNYRAMIEFCCGDRLILNNSIIENYVDDYEIYCGDCIDYYDCDGNLITVEEANQIIAEGGDIEERYRDIYQYYIVDGASADRLADYTNELVAYIPQIDMYLLCVCHFGTPWDSVEANWQ